LSASPISTHHNLQGGFEQVDATALTGRFYVKPGKIRLDCAAGGASYDGSPAIEDAELRRWRNIPSVDALPPASVRAVDLSRDARVVGVESQDGTLAVTLEDKSGDAAGSIRLVFHSGPELQLKEWSIADAQGLTTRVTVSDVVPGRKVAADFFSAKEGFQPFR
jgi:hypothetical protein